MTAWQAFSMAARCLLLHRADVGVRPGRRHLDDREGLDEAGVVVDQHAGDLEVLQRPRGLNSVVLVGGDLFLSEKILLGPEILLTRGERHTQHQGKRRNSSYTDL